MNDATLVYDRATGETYEEKQFGDAGLRFLYGNRLGRLLRPLATNRLTSEVAALPRRLPWSRRDIDDFVADYGVDLADYVAPEGGYRSFADFFVRDWAPDARPVDPDPQALLSPADGKLLLVPIDGRRLKLKGVEYDVADLLGESHLADRFRGGTAVIVRLTLDDAHRYCYPATGRTVRGAARRSKLDTVGPRGGGSPVLASNSRTWDLLDTDTFGRLVQLEVGALLVGRIIDEHLAAFKAGDEKGRFELGGSTVVLLVRAGAVEFDADLESWSAKGTETRVRARERIGVAP
ncbi:MAG TPA: phosphatidylserine decarboxylase [Propionibacteriaceae bacterium]|nr:phosphatidylserine decarboxylase [Propionibacteriaceae bacterium]